MVWTLLKYGYAFFVPIYSSTAFEYTSTGKPLEWLEVPGLGSKGPDLDGSTPQALFVASEVAQRVRADR